MGFIEIVKGLGAGDAAGPREARLRGYRPGRLGWAGLGLELGCGAGLGWARSSGFETEIGLLENGEVVSRPEKKQQQQAISIYFFLEGLGFRV